MKQLATLLLVLGAGLATSALQSGEKQIQGGDKALPLDKEILGKTAEANNAEVEVTKLVEKRADSSLVKDYAKNVQKDHQAAAEKIGALMKAHKLGAVVGLDRGAQEQVKRLSGLAGKEFDQAFLQHMVGEHKKAITLFENQAKNGKEKDIRDFAMELTPDLRRHLQRAEELIKTASK